MPDTQATGSTCTGWRANRSAPAQAGQGRPTSRRTIWYATRTASTCRRRLVPWNTYGFSRMPVPGSGDTWATRATHPHTVYVTGTYRSMCGRVHQVTRLWRRGGFSVGLSETVVA